MPAETVPDHDIRYHLVVFDKYGQERPEGSGLYSRVLLGEAAANEPTDVFLFSHGWNGDVTAALQQYGNWLAAMASCAEDRAAAAAMPGGFRPLLVGLHWPSKAWGDEELGDGSFSAEMAAEEPGEGAGGDVGDVQLIIDRYASRLTDSPQTRQALRTIIESALVNPVPVTLPPEVREAYQLINAETGMGQAGLGAAPGDDREPFDAEATYQACLQEELVSFGGLSLGGVLAPLRVLTFWEMKRRARVFGESGATALLTALQEAAPGARFHLMGHSFGCIVASAALAGPASATRVPRTISTLILVQGAMSLWSLCSSIPARPERHGYFNPIATRGLVDGPILVTTSVHDRAVGTFYPLGARAAGQVEYGQEGLPVYGGAGTFGLRGAGLQVTDEVARPVKDAYDFRAGVAYNLDADDVISRGKGAAGAHSDICHPEIAHAVWQGITACRR